MNRQGGRHRPPPMAAVHRDSRAISKPMISKPQIKIWHVLPPEIIHIDAANFRDLVQRLTGPDPAATAPHHTKKTARTRNPQAQNAAVPLPQPPPLPPAEASEPSSSSSHGEEEACIWYEQGIKQEEEEVVVVVEEEEEEEEKERMFWMEESSGFLRALEEDQNGDDDDDQFLLQGLGDFHLLPYLING
uniref:VQ domain-containing protein n=1 Tax=Ananas comosus var. bracteatus TaxID=296719 RepID=A0A6V7PL92_ANACO|nr:unnamed protein product [Ananas comosus var. bracteatus]